MVSDYSKIEVYDETMLRALEKKLGISVKRRELLKSALEQILDALGIEYEEITLKVYKKKEEAEPSVQKTLF